MKNSSFLQSWFMKNSSFLQSWLMGYSLHSLRDLNTCLPNLTDGLWVSINYELPLHLVNKSEQMLGLDEAWRLNRAYYEEAIKIALDYNGYDLDHEDRGDILYELGEPPNAAHPIYLVTIKNSLEEVLVYVGKSGSNKSRFSNGHPIAIKLLDPKYDGFEKRIYWAQIMLWNDEHQHLPLEFVGDKSLADDILDDVESRLIHYLKPTLNEKKTKSLKTKLNIGSILIEKPNDPSGFSSGKCV